MNYNECESLRLIVGYFIFFGGGDGVFGDGDGTILPGNLHTHTYPFDLSKESETMWPPSLQTNPKPTHHHHPPPPPKQLSPFSLIAARPDLTPIWIALTIWYQIQHFLAGSWRLQLDYDRSDESEIWHVPYLHLYHSVGSGPDPQLGPTGLLLLSP